jgi:aryl-alcohol dehydrogenase-like predicted oxidoreductase
LTNTLATAPFGRTGNISSRVLFGGAAFKPDDDQQHADRTLELLLDRGVNHIDTAHSYGSGNSEVLIGSWKKRYRERFFLATKTGGRTAEEARSQLALSLERLCVDSVDLIQLHNLVDPAEWEQALGAGGALEALQEARDQGKVRHIGVTGHGLTAPAMHIRSIERFAFDSVLVPFNFILWSNPSYRADVERLKMQCDAKGIAVQIIKSIARRPWGDRERTHGPWYEPLVDPEDIQLAVRWVLSYDGVFLNSASDTGILPLVLDAATNADGRPADSAMEKLVAAREMLTIFD